MSAAPSSTAFRRICEPLAAKHKPQNSYAASISLPYAIACCLIRGRFGLEETEEAAFTDPVLHNLARKVSYEIDPIPVSPSIDMMLNVESVPNAQTVARALGVHGG